MRLRQVGWYSCLTIVCGHHSYLLAVAPQAVALLVPLLDCISLQAPARQVACGQLQLQDVCRPGKRSQAHIYSITVS